MKSNKVDYSNLAEDVWNDLYILYTNTINSMLVDITDNFEIICRYPTCFMLQTFSMWIFLCGKVLWNETMNHIQIFSTCPNSLTKITE